MTNLRKPSGRRWRILFSRRAIDCLCSGKKKPENKDDIKQKKNSDSQCQRQVKIQLPTWVMIKHDARFTRHVCPFTFVRLSVCLLRVSQLFNQFFLLAAELFRYSHNQSNIEITAATALNALDALVAEPDQRV